MATLERKNRSCVFITLFQLNQYWGEERRETMSLHTFKQNACGHFLEKLYCFLNLERVVLEIFCISNQ